MKRLLFFLINILSLTAGLLMNSRSDAFAQARYQPYSFQFYQKLNDSVYSTRSAFHSSIKPFIVSDTLLRRPFDKLMSYGSDNPAAHSWVKRKLFNEHLIDIRKPDYTFYADYLADLTIGREFSNARSIWLNTRGYQVSASIGDNFYFYTSGFENQAVFADYFDNYTNQTGMVSGQAYERQLAGGKTTHTKDWSYVTALVSYTPAKYLNIALGHDKNFIGDGYRSMLLSDFSSPYTFLKLTGNLGSVRYMVMWTYMQDPSAKKFSIIAGNRKKWGVFHYLDWNVTERLSLGLFDAIIWADADESGNKRGFDLTYGNPIIFLRPLEASNGSPDNSLLGFNGKYEISEKIIAYGQFALDEFEARNFFSGKGSSRNKYGWQFGLRGANLFNVNRLNYLLEYNEARPYTYSQTASILNYGQQNEPLAHPFGGNFKELVGLVNYSYRRFDLSGQFNYSRYGLDADGRNWGKNIALDYRSHARYSGGFNPDFFNNVYATNGNYIGQGIKTNLSYLEAKIAYLLNPKTNLRIELSTLFRHEHNNRFIDNTRMVTIGLRSSFRNLYQDITRNY